jgi:hypothetical protein
MWGQPEESRTSNFRALFRHLLPVMGLSQAKEKMREKSQRYCLGALREKNFTPACAMYGPDLALKGRGGVVTIFKGTIRKCLNVLPLLNLGLTHGK